MNRFVIPVPRNNLGFSPPHHYRNFACGNSMLFVILPDRVDRYPTITCPNCRQARNCSMVLERIYPRLQSFNLFTDDDLRIGRITPRLMEVIRDSFEAFIGEHSGKRRP